MQRFLLNGLSCKELVKRTRKQLLAGRISRDSAQLSFYFLLSTFPLLIFVTALLGYFLEVRALLNDAIQNYLRAVAPQSVTGLLNQTLREITAQSSGGKISLGLLGSLWVGSSGVLAIIRSLNDAYDVKEFRPWWRRRLLAIVLALAGMALVITSLILLVYGGQLIEQIAGAFHVTEPVIRIWTFLHWPILLCLIFVAFYGLYCFGPNVKHPRWSHVVPGTLCAMLVWFLVSYGFKIYLLYFNRYSVTYGSIGAVMILLLWFYFTGIAILLGGEINSVIENNSADKRVEEQKGAERERTTKKSC